MEFALDQVFGVKQRDTLRQKAMGSVMMIVFIVAVIVAVAANNAAAFIPFMPIGGFFTGWAVLVGLLIAIYRLVPNRTFQLRDVWQGAVLAGLLIEILTFAFPIYSRFSGGFNTYGQQFALFLLLAAWFAFLSQFLLLGAVFNRLRLGQPDVEGLMAAPASDSKDVPRPADAIKAQQAETEHPGRAPQGDDRDEVQASRRRAGSTARSGARRPLIAKIIGVILTAAIVASGVLRRKRRARQVA